MSVALILQGLDWHDGWLVDVGDKKEFEKGFNQQIWLLCKDRWMWHRVGSQI